MYLINHKIFSLYTEILNRNHKKNEKKSTRRQLHGDIGEIRNN